ncbi:EscU/YscU/HrcU family type III secretion system export apparatus switch protein [bacterium]|nr:EscU/YscU/HrcU family type III secretion system export apparatus switch protein [bacterium]
MNPDLQVSPLELEEIAVAIRYLFGEKGEAPRVVASGRGLLAKKIIEEAKKHNVPIEKEEQLARALAKIPVGLEIPPELWEVMAEVLAHIYRLDGSLANER